MIKSIISLTLLVVSAFLSFKHAWDALHSKDHPESTKMMADLGIKASYAPVLALLSITIGLLLLFPKTFFLGNLLNAMTILIIMALALHTGNMKLALIEIPFLMMPLVLIWLKYPFKN